MKRLALIGPPATLVKLFSNLGITVIVKQFVKKDVPDEMPEFNVGPGPHKIAPLLVTAKLAASNGASLSVEPPAGPDSSPASSVILAVQLGNAGH